MPPCTYAAMPLESIHPPNAELDLARRECREVLPVVRVGDERRLRIRDRRAAEVLPALDRLHVVVLEVRQVERLGDDLRGAEAGERNVLRQAQRDRLELRPFHRVAADAERTVRV